MKELFLAIELKRKYNKMELEDCVSEFETYTNQKVPKEAIEEFKFIGLNNVDFFTSDWLNRYNLKNLLQFENGL
jgi:hypothetical protein